MGFLNSSRHIGFEFFVLAFGFNLQTREIVLSVKASFTSDSLFFFCVYLSILQCRGHSVDSVVFQLPIKLNLLTRALGNDYL